MSTWPRCAGAHCPPCGAPGGPGCPAGPRLPRAARAGGPATRRAPRTAVRAATLAAGGCRARAPQGPPPEHTHARMR